MNKRKVWKEIDLEISNRNIIFESESRMLEFYQEAFEQILIGKTVVDAVDACRPQVEEEFVEEEFVEEETKPVEEVFVEEVFVEEVNKQDLFVKKDKKKYDKKTS